MIKNVQEFLAYFGNQDETIIKAYKFIPQMGRKCMVQISTTQIEQENLNADIYFIPNLGGCKDEEITTYRDVFVDLDAGRNENKDYYPLDIVDRFKRDKLKAIDGFFLKFTFLVETRNGFHVHYLLKTNCERATWRKVMTKIITYFGSDPQACNDARLMRLPFTQWVKDPDNPFLVKLVGFNDVRYAIEEINSVLDDLGVLENCDIKQKDNVLQPAKTTSNIELIKEAGNIQRQLVNKKNDNKTKANLKDRYLEIVQLLQVAVNTKPVTVSSHTEVYDHLKKQNLAVLLGVNPQSFCCVFHDDHNPSAGIVQNKETGHYILNCFSSDCGRKGTIIQVTERLTHLNKVKALNFLRKVYQVVYVETDWQKQQKNLLDANMSFLNSEDFRTYYPEIYKRTRNYLNILYRINGLAKEHVNTENYTDNEDNALFFASIRYLAKICNITNIGGFNSRIGLLAYFGLINKLSDDEIPKFLLKNAKQNQAVNNRTERTSYFSIPSYSDDTLEFGETKAKEYDDSHFTMRGFSREMLLRTYGEAEADRVYPQMSGKLIPKLNNDIALEMEKTCVKLIESKGWTTENEIIDQVKLYFHGQKVFKETEFKRIIADILQKYNLSISRANKKLKQRFTDIPKKALYAVIFLADDE